MAFFPPASQAAASVSLSSSGPCGPGGCRRRVNLTMLNAGQEPTEFQVTVADTHGPMVYPLLLDARYTVAAGQVLQVDSLPLPTRTSSDPGRSGGGTSFGGDAWIIVSAAQPFLF